MAASAVFCPQGSLAQLIEMAGGVVVNNNTVPQLRDGRVVHVVEKTDEGRDLYPVVTSNWILDCISEYQCTL